MFQHMSSEEDLKHMRIDVVYKTKTFLTANEPDDHRQWYFLWRDFQKKSYSESFQLTCRLGMSVSITSGMVQTTLMQGGDILWIGRR